MLDEAAVVRPRAIRRDIEPEGELTLMRFDLRGVDGFSGDGSYYDGWEQALDSLTTYLAQNR